MSEHTDKRQETDRGEKIDLDVSGYRSNCCGAEIAFYDWFVCGDCGDFIHDPRVDATKA